MKKKLLALMPIMALCLLLSLPACKKDHPGDIEVTTIAGGSPNGPYDGQGVHSWFSLPYGLAVDLAGNIYVSDFQSNKIRKITPGGVVTTIAGTGQPGDADGPGNVATFFEPSGVAVDAAGNVYVADFGNYRIRKITPDGMVSTFAGSGDGMADGPVSTAKFIGPAGVAVDKEGNMYVADFLRIRKISAGMVSTLAGSATNGNVDGVGAAAAFFNITAIALDNNNNVYVTDNGIIKKISPQGLAITIAGSNLYGYVNGTGAIAQFLFPLGITVDKSGNIYVADTGNNSIRKVTSAGVVSTLAGTNYLGAYLDGNGLNALFYNPDGITIDSNGNLYVADTRNGLIRKITISR